MTITFEAEFTTKDGTKLYTKSWKVSYRSLLLSHPSNLALLSTINHFLHYGRLGQHTLTSAGSWETFFVTLLTCYLALVLCVRV